MVISLLLTAPASEAAEQAPGRLMLLQLGKMLSIQVSGICD